MISCFSVQGSQFTYDRTQLIQVIVHLRIYDVYPLVHSCVVYTGTYLRYLLWSVPQSDISQIYAIFVTKLNTPLILWQDHYYM